MFGHEFVHPDVTGPHPPIDDSFPHPALLEQLRIADGQLVDRFLSTIADRRIPDQGKIRSPVTTPVDIAAYRVELANALQTLDSLKHTKLVLEELSRTKDDSDGKWTAECERANHLQGLLLDMLDQLENPERTQRLAEKLAIRRKKRSWQKRRNQRLKEARATNRAARDHRLEEISAWEAQWEQRLERERAAREELQRKTLVLNDVRCRKAKAKRFLSRFEKSRHLRRVKNATTESRDAKAEDKYDRKMESLIAEWQGKLSESIKEERSLKDELNRQSAGNESRRKENRWRKVLFGTPAASGGLNFNRTEVDDWWSKLLDTRRAWDQFVVEVDEKSSTAPSAWHLPPEHPQSEWAMYREAKGKGNKKTSGQSTNGGS